MEWVFHYRWGTHGEEEKDKDGDWRHKWTNLPFHLKIVSSEPTVTVDVYNPRINWVREAKKRPGECWVELPDLWHIPIRGRAFAPPETCQGRLFVRDHGWAYYTGEGETVPKDVLFLENQGRARWEERWKKGSEGSPEERRLFCTACREMGEWESLRRAIPGLWEGPYLRYIQAISDNRRMRRLSEPERDLILLDALVKTGWDGVWMDIIRLSMRNPGWDLRIPMMSLVAGASRWPPDLATLPSGTCVPEEMLSEACVLEDYPRLLADRIFEKTRLSFLFRKILHTGGSLSPCLNWIPAITVSCADAETGQLLYSTDDADYVPSSSSLVVYPENPDWYLVNVRRVNYRIQSNGSYISFVGGKISPHYNGITKNEFYFMDRETLRPVSDVRPMREDIPGRRHQEIAIVGIEDVRLVEEENGLAFYGVTKSYSYMDAIRIIYGRYDVATSSFRDATVMRPPYEENSCEKNWAWCGKGRFIYRWHPIEIGSVAASTKLEIDEMISSPAYFKEFRGSSAGVEWKGLMWFIVHSVHYVDGLRRYVHYVVVLDLSAKAVVGVSDPFLFEALQIEYSIGFDIFRGRVLFFYSTRDSTSRMVRIPLVSLLDRMWIDPAHKTAFYCRLFS